MNWSDIKGFLGDAAPVIGTLLGGSAGGAVGGLIAKALGVEDKPDAIIDALKNNPDALLKIKELENSKAIAELQASLDQHKLYAESEKANLATITNAQNMQVAALNQSDTFSKQFVYWFAIGWSLFAMGYIGFITFGDIPANNIRFADTILGFLLGTAISGILQFFYGSSLGSRNAQEALLKTTQN